MSTTDTPAIGRGAETYLKRFTARADARSGEPGWLRDRREEAMARFAAAGFPTTRSEAWKYTSLADIAGTDWADPGSDPASRPDVEGRELDDALLLVLVDGQLDTRRSRLDGLPDGAVVSGLAEALERRPEAVREALEALPEPGEQVLGDLNAALAVDGAWVEIPEGRVVERPIHILNVTATAGALVQPRTLVLAGAGSQVTLVEEFAGDAGAFTNAATGLLLQPGAIVEHVRLVAGAGPDRHVGLLQARLARDANLNALSFTLGGELVRNDVQVSLDDEGAECSLYGLYAANGRRHVDNHTRVDHAKPHGTSRELYKGVLDDAARGVFLGHVKVRPGAQKTSAWQTNKNLLLSSEALANSTPQLEIYADDVQCRHGSTIGQLDDDVVFYLRSRGIGPDRAREVLVRAFAGEIIQKVRLPRLRERIESEAFAADGKDKA